MIVNEVDNVVVEYRDAYYGTRRYGRVTGYVGDTVLIACMGGGLSWAHPASAIIRRIEMHEYVRIVPEHAR
jgi:hypothetical protein